MSGKTFYGDLHAQAVANFIKRRDGTAAHLADACKTAHGLGANGLCSRLTLMRKGVLALPEPGRTWKDVIGISTRAYVSEVRGNGKPTKHGGWYFCRVKRADNEVGYVVQMKGPKGETEWWEGCGMSGTAAFRHITGGWRHHPRLFFGLRAEKGKPRRKRRAG